MPEPTIEAIPCSRAQIDPFRDALRTAADCQIVRDSILPRGLADAYVLIRGGRDVGYAAVWNRHFPGRVMELHLDPQERGRTDDFLRALQGSSRATQLEVQTNLPDADWRRGLIRGESIENLLFADGPDPGLRAPGVEFRARAAGDDGPEGDWVLAEDGRIVAAGGFLLHYNPPFADLYMEVEPGSRGRGRGAFLVQELARECRQRGLRPAARCDPGNQVSVRTLQRGGLVRCGEIVSGALVTTETGRS